MIILSYKKGHDLRCPRGCCFEGHVDSECLLVYRWPNEVAPYIVLTNQDEENEWVHLVFPDTATLEAHLKEGDIDADGQALQIFMDSEEDSNAMRGEVNRLQKEANVKREKGTGTIYSVRNRPLFSGYYLCLKMKPTESLGSDVIISVPKNINVTNLNKGDTITVIGRITAQGGVILDHGLDWLGQ